MQYLLSPNSAGTHHALCPFLCRTQSSSYRGLCSGGGWGGVVIPSGTQVSSGHVQMVLCAPRSSVAFSVMSSLSWSRPMSSATTRDSSLWGLNYGKEPRSNPAATGNRRPPQVTTCPLPAGLEEGLSHIDNCPKVPLLAICSSKEALGMGGGEQERWVVGVTT